MTTTAPGQHDLGLGPAAERGSALSRSGRAITRFVQVQPGEPSASLSFLIVVVAAIFAPYLNTIGEGEHDVRRIALFTTAIERSLPIIVIAFAFAFAFAPLTTLVLRSNVL